jgi:hypothetical protein
VPRSAVGGTFGPPGDLRPGRGMRDEAGLAATPFGLILVAAGDSVMSGSGAVAYLFPVARTTHLWHCDQLTAWMANVTF